MSRAVLLAAVCAAVILGPAHRVPAGFDEGLAAYTRGDYATTIRELRPLAERGDPEAQYFLGHMYNTGLGAPRDYGEALKWYRKAAAKGHARSQYDLGNMYHWGRGVPRDDVQALMWLSLADRNGNDSARRSGDVVARTMTAAEIAEARKRAREWTPEK